MHVGHHRRILNYEMINQATHTPHTHRGRGRESERETTDLNSGATLSTTQSRLILSLKTAETHHSPSSQFNLIFSLPCRPVLIKSDFTPMLQAVGCISVGETMTAWDFINWK